MVKKRSASLVRGVRRDKSAKTTAVLKDSEINFSDIPEFSKEELKRARPVGRPKLKNPKRLMAIRFSPDLIYKLRKLAAKKRKPYQTLLHDLLKKAVREAA